MVSESTLTVRYRIASEERVRRYLHADHAREVLQEARKDREHQHHTSGQQPEEAVSQAQALESHQVEDPSGEGEQRHAGEDLQLQRKERVRHPESSALRRRSTGRRISASETLIR